MPSKELPAPGFGTSLLKGDEGRAIIGSALNIGYRHLDTAQMYRNLGAVGAAIANSDLPRDEVFLSLKVHAENLAAEDVIRSTERSLEQLQVDEVDLLSVHWPLGAYHPEDTLPAFQQLYEREKTRHIGLSNFTPEQLDEARDVLDVPLFAHQVEMHPLYRQNHLLEYARENDHHLVAYTPLAKGAVFEEPTITALAEELGITPAQVSLAWIMNKGIVPLPHSTNEEHIRQNFEARDISLEEEAIDRVESIERQRKIIDPESGLKWL